MDHVESVSSSIELPPQRSRIGRNRCHDSPIWNVNDRDRTRKVIEHEGPSSILINQNGGRAIPHVDSVRLKEGDGVNKTHGI